MSNYCSQANAASPPTPDASREPIRLQIRGCGNIANFKNAKRAVKGGLITEPKMKARMQAIQRAIECALRSAFQTGGGATSMAARRQFLTHSCPPDDCWSVIPELILTGELVTDGSEGVDITIERITGTRPPDARSSEVRKPSG